MSMYTSDHVPFNIITGFLGSGKTTILKKILEDEQFGDSAILINEFGEVGIDDLIISEVSRDVVVLKSGCVCCTIRGELSESIKSLFEKRRNGEIPYFKRIILETTGLADPSPISATLVHDSVLKNNVILGQTLTVIDALNWENNKNEFTVWLDQVSASDQVWIGKKDLVSEESVKALTILINDLNPACTVVSSVKNILKDVFIQNSFKATYSPNNSENSFLLGHESKKSNSAKLDNINSFRLFISEKNFDWFGFGVWLSLLLKKHGNKILRVKGVLYTAGKADPVVIHGVQHIIHPPAHVTFLREENRVSRVVFITKGIDKETVENSLTYFMNACKSGED